MIENNQPVDRAISQSINQSISYQPVNYLQSTLFLSYDSNKQYSIAESTKLLKNPMIHVKEQEVTFGKPAAFPSFSWDVEYGTARVR